MYTYLKFEFENLKGIFLKFKIILKYYILNKLNN